MTDQPNQNGNQPPQPSPQVVISIQKQEIDRLNDNRIYMMAVLEEQAQKANEEVGRLNGVISQLKGMLNDDVLEEAEAIINGASHPSQ